MKRGIVFLYLLISLMISISLVDAGQNRIGTRQVDGQWEFYDTGTNQKFVPRGNNFVNTSEYFQPIYLYPAINVTAMWGLNSSVNTLTQEYYNHNNVNASLKEMKDRGYNVVRTFYGGSFYTAQQVETGQRLNQSYLNNTIDFLKLARENELYVILSWGYLATTYYDIVNQTCDNGVPEYRYVNVTIYDSFDPTKPVAGTNYTVCQHDNVTDYNVVTMHQGVINATKYYIMDVLGNISEVDSNLTNGTILGIEMFAEPWFDGNSYTPIFQKYGLPFNITSGTLTITLQNTETYDMSNNMSRQGLADNATRYWIDNIAPEINESYPNIFITVATITPYGSNHGDHYDGVRPKLNSNQMPRVKILTDSPYIGYLDFHMYPDPHLGDIIYNMTREMRSAEISVNATGIYANTTLIQKPIIISEFGARNNTYPTINSAVNNLTLHQNNTCMYNFTGWLLWTWSLGKNPINLFHWAATDENYALAQNLSPYYRPDACSLEHKQYRICGDIENDNPRPTTCDTYVSDFAQCNDDNKCVYSAGCYIDDGNYDTAEYNDATYGDLSCSQGKWCPVGFEYNTLTSKCKFQAAGEWGTNRFIVQDLSGNNVARLDDKGHIVLKGTCTATATCTAPANSFIFKDSSWNTVAYIDSNGNLCIEDANCNYKDASCNPLNNAFIIRDTINVNQIYIDLTNGNLCLKGYLYENSNP